MPSENKRSLLDQGIWFCLKNKVVVGLFVLFAVLWGTLVAPFEWKVGGLPRDPVPVDAIPDIGENQQIVFTKWPGRSPQDIEDQISYPLTTSLLGLPSVKTIRSYSAFGFSSIYIVFKEEVEFYWSRSRVLEKLNSLPPGTLPSGVQPMLGPDATPLGQVFWYTLEGRDKDGNPTGGWDLHELRTAQDWYVRYALQAVDGVSEVASVGGFVQEYQIDVDPDAMRAYGVNLDQVYGAIRMSNVDVGARTIEINRVEYVIRGLGFLKKLSDIEKAVLKVKDGLPIQIKDVATVSLGPALRRGALDKGGAEAVGGVVVVRYGANPLAVINRLKAKIKQISTGLPKKTLEDGTVSQVTVVPFYDRSGLIRETLGTLNTALSDEILVTIIVVLVMVMHLRSSILISSLLPIAVLMCFIAMKTFGVDANIVALSGIAIAIGTMVDMGIVICENILKHLAAAPKDKSRLHVIFEASSEVGSAVLTAVLTTVVSFLPVFTMEAAEGKLFRPLAFTKTFALISSVLVALAIIPPLAHMLFVDKKRSRTLRTLRSFAILVTGVVLAIYLAWLPGAVLAGFGLYLLVQERLPAFVRRALQAGVSLIVALIVAVLLSKHWVPLGPEHGLWNEVFVVLLVGGILGGFRLFQWLYEPILRLCLAFKPIFLLIPFGLVLWGMVIWLGVPRVFGFLPKSMKGETYHEYAHAFPGLGKEFMPPLDEGSYLLMPQMMFHASIGEAMDVLQKQDRAIMAIPEVSTSVGKIGRVESSLDPAPIAMIETVINYKPEYKIDAQGHRLRFRYDEAKSEFVRDESGKLIEDEDGRPFRQWRPKIKKPDDIWKEILRVSKVPGTSSAPRLQPIAARIVMLASGMRAPMGVKVYGPDLKTIEKVGIQIEGYLKQLSSVKKDSVIADRIVGKPYLEIEIDRDAIARYGMHIQTVQNVIEVAIGGKRVTTTVEGRERFPVRVRYARELRDQIDTLEQILVPGASGEQIPLKQLTKIRYRPGPQVIKSEDTFLVGYVVFDMMAGHAEVDVVEECQRFLQAKIDSGDFVLPKGVSYKFAGNYENQIRSEKRMMIVLPLALFVIFMILYFQFGSVFTTLIVFSGVFVAWAGGFQMLWLYSQDWFLDFAAFGVDMRELFQVHPINLSVAVWVGFLALFGIATDDGVILGTYLKQTFDREKPESIRDIREATIHAGLRRIRPCLMTVGTTILALIPVLTSTGRGSDVMVPMAIPSFGGMTVVLVTVFVVPTLFCMIEEWKFRLGLGRFRKEIKESNDA